MRSQRRRQRVEHVLFAGSAADVDTVALMLELLPEHAYGQVYVETGDAEPPVLTAPPRVTVTWLRPPQELSQVVSGWLGEWMPDQPTSDRNLTIWIGDGVCDSIKLRCEELSVRAQQH